jgi:DNA-binding NarL/FixJ family response regulator
VIRNLIVDDHPVVRAGLQAVLDVEPDLEVVGEAARADQAVDLVASLSPDLVLMDLQLADQTTGTAATRQIRAQDAPPSVLVLTNYDSDGDILSAVEAGASGYLLKDAPPDELIAAIRAAAAGESALAPTIASRLLERIRTPHLSLSAREIEVLRLVDSGATNAQIAARLHITDATVKSHLVHVYAKLGVSTRTAAASAARAHGILR